MKRFILTIVAIFAIFTSQAQVLKDAVMRIPLNEASSKEMPTESVANAKCRPMNDHTLGDVFEDETMGMVRCFQNCKNGILTKMSPVYGSDARTYSFWAYTNMTDLSNDGKGEAVQNNTQPFTTGSMDKPMGGFFMQIVQGKRIRIGINAKYTHVLMFPGIGKELRDSWHHFAVTIPEGGSAADAKCYIDGIDCGAAQTVNEKGEKIDNFTLKTAKTVFNIAPQFGGMISQVAIFDKVLSEGDVQKLMKETRQ
ncbi:MAG: LamG-like jellyroll fold domain-containing protein [Rikenellaceae bacterium]